MVDYGQAISLNPKSATAYASRGEAYRSNSEDDRAIADFDQAIKLEPKLVSALIGRGLAQEDKNDYTRAIATAYDERASAYEHTGAHDRALADIAQAIKLDPQNPDAHRLQ